MKGHPRTRAIGVIGCGTAGPSVARLLARQGHRVTLLERVLEPLPVGAGITLQPTGLSVLHQLGVLGEVLEHGSQLARLYGRTKSGRMVLDLRYADLNPAFFGLGIHRGALFRALFRGLSEDGVRLQAGCDVRTVGERKTHAFAEMADGARQDFDLLVVCDGARSRLRSVLPIVRQQEYPWGALWAVLPSAALARAQSSEQDDSDLRLSDTLIQFFDSTQRFVGFLPTGTFPEGKAITSLFWSAPVSQFSALRRQSVSAFRDGIVDLLGTDNSFRSQREQIRAFVEGLDSPEQLLPATYYDVVVERPHTERIVFLGDAAHAMSPQLGQGANLALYDAWVLAEVLRDADGPPGPHLRRYAEQRRSHLAFYQWATRLLTPFFQSNWTSLGLLRDITVGYLCRLPFFSNQGLGAMVGYKAGIFDKVPVRRHPGLTTGRRG